MNCAKTLRVRRPLMDLPLVKVERPRLNAACLTSWTGSPWASRRGQWMATHRDQSEYQEVDTDENQHQILRKGKLTHANASVLSPTCVSAVCCWSRSVFRSAVCVKLWVLLPSVVVFIPGSLCRFHSNRRQHHSWYPVHSESQCGLKEFT